MNPRKKKVTPSIATAKLDKPLHKRSGEELVTVTKSQVQSIQGSPGYPNQPAVQTAATTLLASNDAYEKTLAAIAQKKAEIDVLVGSRDTQRAIVLRDRSYLEAAVTAAAKGVPEAVQALNCIVSTRTTTVQPTSEAPTHLVLKNSLTTPGTLSAKCKAIRGAASYVFAITTDPNALPGAGTTVMSSRSTCEIAGQALGHVLYVRVAAVRKVGGQSAWSDPAQFLVR